MLGVNVVGVCCGQTQVIERLRVVGLEKSCSRLEASHVPPVKRLSYHQHNSQSIQGCRPMMHPVLCKPTVLIEHTQYFWCRGVSHRCSVTFPGAIASMLALKKPSAPSDILMSITSSCHVYYMYCALVLLHLPHENRLVSVFFPSAPVISSGVFLTTALC